MKRDEIKAIAEELSRKAAANLATKQPENMEKLDIPSVAAGMRLARDAVIETCKAVAEAYRRNGSHIEAAVMEKMAEDMILFPILGETDDKKERH